MGYREDVMGLVKHFHHQPNISGASSVNTIVKVCSNTAQPQKYLYFLMREERVLLHLVQLLKYIYIKKKTQPRNICIIPHRKSAEPAD